MREYETAAKDIDHDWLNGERCLWCSREYSDEPQDSPTREVWILADDPESYFCSSDCALNEAEFREETERKGGYL